MLDPILTYSWQMKEFFLDKEFLLLWFLALHNHLSSVYLAVFSFFTLCNLTSSLMNALVYINIGQGIHKRKSKVAWIWKRKKLHGFSYSKNIVNFESFCCTAIWMNLKRHLQSSNSVWTFFDQLSIFWILLYVLFNILALFLYVMKTNHFSLRKTSPCAN